MGWWTEKLRSHYSVWKSKPWVWQFEPDERFYGNGWRYKKDTAFRVSRRGGASYVGCHGHDQVGVWTFKVMDLNFLMAEVMSGAYDMLTEWNEEE
jgi:hypothetical protein